jgi:hypothetical protein
MTCVSVIVAVEHGLVNVRVKSIVEVTVEVLVTVILKLMLLVKAVLSVLILTTPVELLIVT